MFEHLITKKQREKIVSLAQFVSKAHSKTDERITVTFTRRKSDSGKSWCVYCVLKSSYQVNPSWRYMQCHAQQEGSVWMHQEAFSSLFASELSNAVSQNTV